MMLRTGAAGTTVVFRGMRRRRQTLLPTASAYGCSDVQQQQQQRIIRIPTASTCSLSAFPVVDSHRMHRQNGAAAAAIATSHASLIRRRSVFRSNTNNLYSFYSISPVRVSQSVRWQSTSGDGKNPNDAAAPTKATEKEEAQAITEHAAEQQPRTTQTAKEAESEASSSSLLGGEESATRQPPTRSTASIASDAVAAATATQHQLEQRLKRVVDDLNLGDLVSVTLIAVFTAVLLMAPYAVRHMKQQAETFGYDDRLQTDDPVDEFAKLARREWGMLDEVDPESKAATADDGNNRNVVEFLLKDVFKSTALQHAAQEFVVQILQSDRFKEAVSRLVKELWSDLVTDPETVAQVVKLLEIAIQNSAVKNAVVELVLQIVGQEPELREALLGMIDSLAQDDAVREAVVSLLTDAAHATLNDPDLLDHSMEFATDVVGDDIVQQTAGEALRKSVGHAVKPATTVFLTSLGVGLLIFSVVAVGYSRSSEQEAALFESAARSLHSNATSGILRLVTWPLRALQTAVCRACTALWVIVVPSRPTFVINWRAPLHRTSEAVYQTLRYAAGQTLALPWLAVTTAARWISATGAILLRQAGDRMQTSRRATMFRARSVGSSFVTTAGAMASSVWSLSVAWSMQIGKSSLAGLSSAGTCAVDFLMRLVVSLQSMWRRTTGNFPDVE